jgi:polyisoprenoid-binding protein YceI
MRTTRGWLPGGLALLYAATVLTQAAEGWTEYRARPGAGNKILIDGTANMIHEKWKVRGLIIGGTVEVGPSFPTDPASAKPGKLDVKSKVQIPVRSLKSIEDDGRPYSASMDNIMYEKLKMEEHKEITFTLGSLTLKEVKDGAYQCEAEGDLTVAGASKKITMPVEVSVPEENRLKFAGQVDVKMTDFGIEPPAPAIAGGLIKTGDEIKLTFEWIAVKRQ